MIEIILELNVFFIKIHICVFNIGYKVSKILKYKSFLNTLNNRNILKILPDIN